MKSDKERPIDMIVSSLSNVIFFGDKDLLLPASQLTAFDHNLLFKLSTPVGGMTLTGEQVTRLKELQSRAIYL